MSFRSTVVVGGDANNGKERFYLKRQTTNLKQIKMTNFSTISATLAAQREQLFSKYPLKSLAIFGSVSRGDNGPDSDVDIMVEFSKPVGMEFLDLAFELEDLLGCKVDLVTRNGVKDRYFKYIEPDLKYV